MTLVEYGSYACRNCHAVHEVIEGLRSRFGERMRYVFRHLPVVGNEDALRAAELARSEEHTSELQSRQYLACRLLLETTTFYRLLSSTLQVTVWEAPSSA